MNERNKSKNADEWKSFIKVSQFTESNSDKHNLTNTKLNIKSCNYEKKTILTKPTMSYTSYYSILMSGFINGSETSNESGHGDVPQQLSDLTACHNPDADG